MKDFAEYVTTHELNVGDVILSHGMKLLIDRDIIQTSHPVDPDRGGPTFATAAVVLNWDEVQEKGDELLVYFIKSDMAEESHRTRNGLAPYTEPRWTIQGNGFATWARVIEGDK